MIQKLKAYVFGVTDKLGKHVRFDLTFLTKSAFWISFGRLSSGVSAFFITLVLSRYMSQEAFGMYKYILSLAAAISAFSFSGLGTAVSQAAAKNMDGTYAEGFKQGIKWSLPAFIIGVGAGLYYIYKEAYGLGLAVSLVTLTNLFLQSTLIWSGFLVGKRRYKEDGMNSALYSGVIAIATIIATLIYPNPFLIAFIYTCSGALISLFLYFKTKRLIKNESVAKEELIFGKQMSVLQVLGSLSTQADKLIVFHFLGVSPLAVYSVATALPQQLRFGSKLISHLSLPRFSSQSLSSVKKSIHRQAFYVFLGSIGMIFVYITLSPLFFQIFFPRYTEGIFLSQVFSLIFLVFPITLYQQALSSHRKIKYLGYIQTIAPTTKIVSLFVFVPLYGLWGVLLSVFIMEIIRAIIVVYALNKTEV